MSTMGVDYRILGAGPAGLSAAICLARAGCHITVYERRAMVGARFNDDFQGIENWTDPGDVLAELAEFGITQSFEVAPISRGQILSPARTPLEVAASEPMVYLVRRGPEAGSLDVGLFEQAKGLGVKFRFGETRPPGSVDIVATGPRHVNALAVGATFPTELGDGAYAIVGDDLAPKGYAYLLVAGGRATLASVLFRDFKRAAASFGRTVAAFVRLTGQQIEPPERWASYGSFGPPTTAQVDGRLLIGEAAGFQDFLFGFGIRWAMVSGALAATSLLEQRDYDQLWQARLGPYLRASKFNRILYERLGKVAYYLLWWTLGTTRRPDLLMRWLYGWAKLPLVRPLVRLAA